MQRLAGASELLDGPLDDLDALRGNLRDLARVNRWLGGAELSRRAVDLLLMRDVSDGRRPTVLDVGTGGADIPLALVGAASRAGRALWVTGLDSRGEVLAAAVAIRPGLRDHPFVELHVSDAHTLPYADASYDVVHASLLAHHLEPPEAVTFLREARRVARLGVVVNDLVRARRHWLAARALFAVTTRNRYTRHDGPLSVRRAYTVPELHALLDQAALRPVATLHGVLGHRVAIAAVPAAAGTGPAATS